MLSIAELRRQSVEDPVKGTRDVQRLESGEGMAADAEEGDSNSGPCIEQLNRHTGEVVRRYSSKFEAAHCMHISNAKCIAACLEGTSSTSGSFKWRVCTVPQTPGA